MKTKITAIVIAAVMILGLSACADTRHALTLNGENIRAGEFIYLQISAAQEAADKFMELYPETDIFADGFDFFRQELEGKSFSDWVNDRAVQMLTEMTAVALLFEELGLEITAEDEINARRNVEAIWGNTEVRNSFGLDYDTLGEFYEDIGVGKDSLTAVLLNGLMEEDLFFALYGEGGAEEVSPEEIENYFAQNFVRYRVIRMPLADLEGQQVYDIEDLALEFASRLNAGESFVTLAYEYEDFVMMRDHVHDDFWNEHEHEHDYDSEDYDEEVYNDEDYNSEEYNSEDYNSEEYGEYDYEEYSDEEEYEDYNGEEHYHGYNEELAEFSFDMPDLFAQESDDDFDRLEKIGAFSSLGESGQEFLLNMPMNSASVYADEEDVFVLQLLPILDRQDWLWEHFEALLFDMKEDDMRSRVSAKAGTVDVVRNEAAIRRYRPETAARRLLQPWL
jgi:hypothetical protein